MVTKGRAFEEDLLVATVAWASRPDGSNAIDRGGPVSTAVPPVSTDYGHPARRGLADHKAAWTKLPHWTQNGATYAVTFRLARIFTRDRGGSLETGAGGNRTACEKSEPEVDVDERRSGTSLCGETWIRS